MADRKRPPVVIWLPVILVGIAGILRVMNGPASSAYRAVDIVQLLGSGVCFGAAIVGVIFMLRRRS